MIRIGFFAFAWTSLIFLASCGPRQNPKEDSQPAEPPVVAEDREKDSTERTPLGEPPKPRPPEPPEEPPTPQGPEPQAPPEPPDESGDGLKPAPSAESRSAESRSADEGRLPSADNQAAENQRGDSLSPQQTPSDSKESDAKNIAEEAVTGAGDAGSQDIAQNDTARNKAGAGRAQNTAEAGTRRGQAQKKAQAPLSIFATKKGLTENASAEERQVILERLSASPNQKNPFWQASLAALERGEPAFDFIPEGGSDLYYWYIQTWLGKFIQHVSQLPPHVRENLLRICRGPDCGGGLDFHKAAALRRGLPSWIKWISNVNDSIVHSGRNTEPTLILLSVISPIDWDRWVYITENDSDPSRLPLPRRPRPFQFFHRFAEYLKEKAPRRIVVNLPPQFDTDPEPFFILGRFIRERNLDIHIAGGCGHYCTAYLLPAARTVYIEPTGYIYYKGDFTSLKNDIQSVIQLEMRSLFLAQKRKSLSDLDEAEQREEALQILSSLQKTEEDRNKITDIASMFQHFLIQEENGEQLIREFNEKIFGGKFESGADISKQTPDQIKIRIDSFSEELLENFVALIKLEFGGGARLSIGYHQKIQYFSAEENRYRLKGLGAEADGRKGRYTHADLLHQAALLLKDAEYSRLYSVPRGYYSIPEQDKHYEWIAPSAGVLRAAGLDVRGENNTDMLDFTDFALHYSGLLNQKILSRMPRRENMLFLDEKTAEECPVFVYSDGPPPPASEIADCLNRAASLSLQAPSSEGASAASADATASTGAGQNPGGGPGSPAEEASPDNSPDKTSPPPPNSSLLQNILLPPAHAAGGKETSPPFEMDSLPLKRKQIAALLGLKAGSSLYQAYLQFYSGMPRLYLPPQDSGGGLENPRRFLSGLCLEADCRSGMDPAKLNPSLLFPLAHAFSLAGLTLTVSDDNEQSAVFFNGRQFPRGESAYRRFRQKTQQSEESIPPHIEVMLNTIDWMDKKAVTKITVSLPHHSIEDGKDPVPFEILGRFIQKNRIDLHIAGGCGPYCAWHLLPAARTVYIEPTGFVYFAGGASGSYLELSQYILANQARRHLKEIEESWFPGLSAKEAQEFVAENLKKSEGETDEQAAQRQTRVIKNLYTLDPAKGDEFRKKFVAAARKQEGVFFIGDMTDDAVRLFVESLSPELIKTAAALLKLGTDKRILANEDELLRLKYYAVREARYFDEIELNSRLKSETHYTYRALLDLSQMLVKDTEYAERFSDNRPFFNIPESEKPYDFVLYDADLLRKTGLNIVGENHKEAIPVFFPNQEDRFLFLNEERIESCQFLKQEGLGLFNKESLNKCLQQAAGDK